MTAHDKRCPRSSRIGKAVFHAMVEEAHDGIILMADGRFLYVNPAFARLAGMSVQELEGRGFGDIMRPEAASLMERRCRDLADGREVKPRRIDLAIVTKGGGERVVSVSSTPITVNRRVATLHVAHDVTRRRSIEQGLESTNRFLAGLIASSSDAIVVSDLKGHALIFNKAAEEITGYSAADMLENRTNIAAFMVPGERDRIMEILDEGTEENPRWVVSEETRIIAKDGSVIPISLSVSYLYSEGTPVAAIGIFRDLRPIKAVQDRLRESEKKYRMLVEKTADGIFVYQDHVFRYTNPAFRELLGYSEDELAGMGLKDIVRPELAGMIEARYEKRIRGEKVPDQYEISLRGKDGRWRAFEITPSVI
ncbi:MAG TPA: PAS domain S-box protein, partial [Deltaproteobacteria bacterium]|nr:PAS domain S-box protein [Deltaproteobacteria bacterium]